MVRKALALALLIASAEAAEEYYIYYSIISSRQTVVEESLKISPAMTKLKGARHHLCSFETKIRSFKEWTRNNKERVIECLLKHSANIRSYNRFDSLLSTKNLDILTSSILPVQVEFNDGLVIINKIQ
ncbi:MAG: hypothetical protein L3J42_06690 [Hydrogenimonas sp.]|nr:hypothetical protein [Hydrogenimonas sp.]